MWGLFIKGFKMKKFCLMISLSVGSIAQAHSFPILSGSFKERKPAHIQFSKLEGSFSERDTLIFNSWATQYADGQSEIERVDNDPFSIRVKGEHPLTEIYNRITGCFVEWFHSKTFDNKINLAGYFLQADQGTHLTYGEIHAYASEFLQFTNENYANCEKTDPFINDPLIDYFGLQDYLLSKNGGLSPNIYYDSIISRTYNSHFIQISQELMETLKNWLGNIQTEYISANPDLMESLISDLTLDEKDGISEEEFAFRFMLSAQKVDPTFTASLKDKNSMNSYVRASQFLFQSCSEQGKFSLAVCHSGNLSEKFGVVRVLGGSGVFFDDFVKLK